MAPLAPFMNTFVPFHRFRTTIRNGVWLAAKVGFGAVFFSVRMAPCGAQVGYYPDHPIKLIVATTAGSLPDVVARLVGERLAASMGRPIVVEDRPGAVGSIGLNAVAKASPDGYTLGMISMPFLAAPSLIAHMPYDTENDLSPVGVICWNYSILAIRSELPVHSVPELIAEAKLRPGTLKYSSPGNATPPHLGMKLFERQTGIELVHVPYKGGPAAATALLRGDVDMYLAGMLTIAPLVRSGAVRLLATMAPRRLAANPELPTMIELGYPELALTDWQGIVAPAGTPLEVIDRLSRELANIVADADMKQHFEQLSMEPAGLGPIEFKRLIRRDLQRWGQFVREAHIRVE
jgi:tripartite-type tricarboxylate transporter receptor subunit TctC